MLAEQSFGIELAKDACGGRRHAAEIGGAVEAMAEPHFLRKEVLFLPRHGKGRF